MNVLAYSGFSVHLHKSPTYRNNTFYRHHHVILLSVTKRTILTMWGLIFLVSSFYLRLSIGTI